MKHVGHVECGSECFKVAAFTTTTLTFGAWSDCRRQWSGGERASICVDLSVVRAHNSHRGAILGTDRAPCSANLTGSFQTVAHLQCVIGVRECAYYSGSGAQVDFARIASQCSSGWSCQMFSTTGQKCCVWQSGTKSVAPSSQASPSVLPAQWTWWMGT